MAAVPLHKRAPFWISTLLLLNALPVFGTTFTVSSTADSGTGSLRAEIAAANGAGGTNTINFSVTGTITLASSLPTITSNLTITGPGASSLAISGNNAVQVFSIASGATVAISGVTIENGACGCSGGGIYNNGTLTLSNSTLSGNSTTGSGGSIYNEGTLTVSNSILSGNFAGSGGGIYNDEKLTVSNSTLSGNSAAGGTGGGIYNDGKATVSDSTLSGNSASEGGGIYNDYAATLTNSTLSGNSATSSGGGIYNDETLTVTNSTLSGNSAPSGSGGGIYNDETATLKNTLLAHGASGGNCSGSFGSDGHNLSDDSTCSFAGIGDINNRPAGLAPAGLGSNGGPTQTIALLAGSTAVDAIPVSPINYCTATDGITPIATDQRGITRPQGPACDIGAFELAPTTTTSIPVMSPLVLAGLALLLAGLGSVLARRSRSTAGS
jgi:predicted outer membrane repeat protein